MRYTLVQDLAADKIPVAVTCRVLGFSKQAFDKWRAAPVSQRDWDDAHLINAAIDILHDDPGFAYRFIADELANQSLRASRNRVNRLCPSQRLWSVQSHTRGQDRNPARRSATTWSSATSPPKHPTTCGRPTSPNTSPPRGPPLREQGRLLQAHRRLLHRRPDDLGARGQRAGQRTRSARRRRHDPRGPPDPTPHDYPSHRGHVPIPTGVEPHRRLIAGPSGPHS